MGVRWDIRVFDDGCGSRAEGRVDDIGDECGVGTAGAQFMMSLDGMGSRVQLEDFSPDRIVANCAIATTATR